MSPLPLRVPAPVSALLRRLPEAPPAQALCMALNAGMAMRVLDRDALVALEGRTLRFEARDLGCGVSVALRNGSFRLAPRGSACDATVRATLADFVALALRREDPDSLFFTRRLVIEGDTDLGLIVKNALDAIDVSRLPAPLRRWVEVR